MGLHGEWSARGSLRRGPVPRVAEAAGAGRAGALCSSRGLHGPLQVTFTASDGFDS